MLGDEKYVDLVAFPFLQEKYSLGTRIEGNRFCKLSRIPMYIAESIIYGLTETRVNRRSFYVLNEEARLKLRLEYSTYLSRLRLDYQFSLEAFRDSTYPEIGDITTQRYKELNIIQNHYFIAKDVIDRLDINAWRLAIVVPEDIHGTK